MAKALVARDNTLIATRLMAGTADEMVQSGLLTMARDSRLALVARDNNQMVTAARAKARAACLQIMRGKGSLTMVARGGPRAHNTANMKC